MGISCTHPPPLIFHLLLWFLIVSILGFGLYVVPFIPLWGFLNFFFFFFFGDFVVVPFYSTYLFGLVGGFPLVGWP